MVRHDESLGDLDHDPSSLCCPEAIHPHIYICMCVCVCVCVCVYVCMCVCMYMYMYILFAVLKPSIRRQTLQSSSVQA